MGRGKKASLRDTFLYTLGWPRSLFWFFHKMLCSRRAAFLHFLVFVSICMHVKVYVCWVKKVSQFSSVTQSCLTLCNPMNCSTPGLPVHHQLLQVTQTQVHRVGDAIQSSHPLSSPSTLAPYPSQHQSLFQ